MAGERVARGASQGALVVKNPPANAGDTGDSDSIREIPWRRAWQLTPVFLPGESHGQRSLAGYSPWSHEELGTTEVTYHAHTRVIHRQDHIVKCLEGF